MMNTHCASHLGDLFLEKTKKDPERVPYFFSHHTSVDNRFSDIYALSQSYYLSLLELGVQQKNTCAFIIQRENPYWHPLLFSLIAHQNEIYPLCSSENLISLSQKISHSNATTLIIPDLLYLEKLKIYSLSNVQFLKNIKKIIICSHIELDLQSKYLGSVPVYSLDYLLQKSQPLNAKYINLFENKLSLLPKNDPLFTFFAMDSQFENKTSFSHFNFLSALENLDDSFDLYFSNPIHNSKILSFLSPSTSLGLLEALLPLYFDLSIYYTPSFEDAYYSLTKTEPDFLFLNPENLLKILKKGLFLNKKKPLDKTLGRKLRKVFILGPFCAPPLNIFFENKKTEYVHSYCISHGVGPLTTGPTQGGFLESIGRPIGDVEIKTEHFKILVSSKAISQNALKKNESFLKTFETGWLDPQARLFFSEPLQSHPLTPKKIEQWLSSFPIVEGFTLAQTLDHESQAGAFVLNKEETISFATEKELIYSSFEALVKHPQVLTLLQSYIDNVNQSLPTELKIKSFAVLPFSWSTESGALNSNLEIQKKVLFEKYSYYFDKLLD